MSIDVLVNPELGQAIKQFSSWYTFLQVYIQGELVGGCHFLVKCKQRRVAAITNRLLFIKLLNNLPDDNNSAGLPIKFRQR